MAGRAAVILAAGQGTRMKSPTPKVLHRVGGRALLDHVIDIAQAVDCARVVVVVGAQNPQVGDAARKRLGERAVVIQDPPLGTGHAVLAAREALADFDGDVLVLNGDCPLLQPSDLAQLLALRGEANLGLLAFEPIDPLLYGRVIEDDDGEVVKIVEARDATPGELAVRRCYAGMMVADRADLFGWLGQVGNRNSKGEYYLTDVVGRATADGAAVRAAVVSESAVMGCDTQGQLAQAEAFFQARRRAALLAAGVAMPAPDTVHLSWDTAISPGATVEPYVVFAPGVTVETGAVIRAFSHLEAAIVRSGALVGPYARLRPGADIGEDAHVGNFVEIKNVRLGKGAKANHLSYLGDGSVGAGANLGAGTIFCNYDGFGKYETHIGANAFIGSQTALVAPVRVGDRAMTASGSVITQDVPDDALALERSPLVIKPGWAARFRERMRALKAARAKA
ncbi:bifunctional UDP-N-acetylglucosamine diphosphorylase/glucosamine-1-phosphate N-acetyltransferase GlmU [Phenylobacterium immobile]|uniref:bifunctional UDP-N-acetylglucosamine diphosphorylase/glucosamine-1-phosphate N-acetyltransferase GlmU n=1 Tax=Phenylobacterium immobile TaxID=21 RepID=UPI000B0CBD31|nr:bifunctional UDP-N-acetylglucosamine diphosphorylase/glucosamine-1-phosphate N-acetyltransferase GlmU [Phenylobacterium immobile]